MEKKISNIMMVGNVLDKKNDVKWLKYCSGLLKIEIILIALKN